MNFRISWVLILLISQFLVSQASAFETQLIRGQIHRPHFAKTQIILRSGERLQLSADNSSTQNNLLRLKEGDHLAGQGVASDQGVQLLSIELVGLKDLLGLWTSTGASPAYYEFEDFQNLTIYGDPFFNKKKAESAFNWFEYTVSPGLGNRWSSHFIQGGVEYSANLVLHGNQLRLNVIHPRTGIVAHRVKLRRVRD